VLDERISSLERKAEEESNFAERLRSKFSKKSYLNLLKSSLSGAFDHGEIDFLSRTDSLIYIVFSEQIQSELQKGLKSVGSFLDEGEKKYLVTQLDEFTTTLNKVFDEGVKAGISPIIIELAIRRWLKIQLPSKGSMPIHKKVNLSLQFFSKREMRKGMTQRSVIHLLEKALPMTVSLNELQLEHFSDFVESGDFFSDVAKVFADCFISPVRLETHQVDYKDAKDKIKYTQDSIKENVEEKLKEVFEKAGDLSVKELRQNIDEIIRYINSGETKVRALAAQLSRLKNIAETYEAVKTPGILRYFDVNLSKKIRSSMNSSVAVLNEKLDSAPDSFLSRSLLGRKADYGNIINWFTETYDEIFLPTVTELIFEEMVKIFPESENDSLEEASWVGLLARKTDPPAVYFIPQIERTLSSEENIVRDNLKTVSVMVYDIRGSSLMGEKLLNAEMEDKIRNEFQSELLKAVEETGGFFVKDTGDGGIVLFSEESSDFYFRQLSMGGGEKKNSEDREIKLKVSSDSATRAIRCARKMLEYSEIFVRKNLKRYKEWFKEFDEKEIDFGGITYEHLPPEYKRIFQIGIGISSGKPGEDIFLGKNVQGYLDLTGSLVRRANMYSTVHHPDRSVILIGASTMYSFLLQVGSFKPVAGEEKIEKSSYPSLPLREKLIDEVILWMKGLSGSYVISEHKVSLQRIDYLIDYKRSEEKLEIPGENVSLKKGTRYYDGKVRTERVLYEVIPEKRT
jgi:class 3 adenylate cyclase